MNIFNSIQRQHAHSNAGQAERKATAMNGKMNLTIRRSPMIGRGLALAMLGFATGLTGCVSDSTPDAKRYLYAEQDRVSDETIAGDLSVIRSMYDRLDQLNENGRPVGDHLMCRARAWTDWAQDEYTENDRSAVTSQALREADKLITAMEADQNAAPGHDIAMIGRSAKIRKDLWAAKDDLINNRSSCNACTIGELEVQLVWMGHEYREEGWRHAVPAIDRAERLVRQARSEASSCNVVTTKVSEPAPVYTESIVERVNALHKRIHFDVSQSRIISRHRPKLDAWAAFLNAYPEVWVRLEGHTDKRSNFGANMKLAMKRADAAKTYLLNQGVESNRVEVVSIGEAAVLHEGCAAKDHAFNRRVEFIAVNAEGVNLVPSTESDIVVNSSQPANCGS